MRIVALDIATKTGIVILDGTQVTVYYIEGSPTYQMGKILQEITIDTKVVVEDFTYFNYRNPETTAKLNQRIGYIIWRLIEDGIEVEKYNVNTVRKFLGVSGSRRKGEQKKLLNKRLRDATGLKLTLDESDAIALLLYNVMDKISDLHKYTFVKKKLMREN